MGAVPYTVAPIPTPAPAPATETFRIASQKEIVEQIVAGKGEFVIAVKDNQPKLKEAMETSDSRTL